MNGKGMVEQTGAQSFCPRTTSCLHSCTVRENHTENPSNPVHHGFPSLVPRNFRHVLLSFCSKDKGGAGREEKDTIDTIPPASEHISHTCLHLRRSSSASLPYPHPHPIPLSFQRKTIAVFSILAALVDWESGVKTSQTVKKMKSF